MKTYFDSKELPHLWVHRAYQTGRCAASMSFDGDSFFSYNARICKRIKVKGEDVYLFNSAKYSDTTTKHQNMLENAISGRIVYIGGDPDGKTPMDFFRHAIAQASYFAAKSKTARLHAENRLASQATWLNRANDVAELFGLKVRADDSSIAKHQRAIERAEKAAKRTEAKKQAELEKQNAKVLKQWLSGKDVSFPYGITRCYLRKHDGEIQTSKGVVVPIPEAERAYRFAVARRSKGWSRNGETFAVGVYQLDAINDQGIVAGCHRFDWQELERFAKLMGW